MMFATVRIQENLICLSQFGRENSGMNCPEGSYVDLYLTDNFQEGNGMQNEGAVNVSNVTIRVLALFVVSSMPEPLADQLYIFPFSWLQPPAIPHSSNICK